MKKNSTRKQSAVDALERTDYIGIGNAPTFYPAEGSGVAITSRMMGRIVEDGIAEVGLVKSNYVEPTWRARFLREKATLSVGDTVQIKSGPFANLWRTGLLLCLLRCCLRSVACMAT